MIQQLTANLPVDSIEPTAAFFAKIGFEVTVRVPEEGPMGFAILANGTQQVMYQTKESLKEDSDAFGSASEVGPVMLYISVDDVKAVASRLKGHDIVMDWRETFYGAIEISYKEPGGHIMTFAEFPDGVK